MNNSDNKTPLWLDLRKEYIDDNFDKLVSYLRTCSTQNKKDDFYSVTLDLLRERVKDLITQLAESHVYDDDDNKKLFTEYNIKLLGTYLLVDGENPMSLEAFSSMMFILMQSESQKLTTSIMQAVSYRMVQTPIENYGFSWNDIIDLQPEILLFKITEQLKIEHPLTSPLVFNKYGTALLFSDGLAMCADNPSKAKSKLRNGAKSLSTTFDVCTITAPGDKLKQTQENDIHAMMSFTKDFILELSHIKPEIQKKPTKLHYAIGDEMVVQVESIGIGCTINVITVDESYEKISGVVQIDHPNVLFYGMKDFVKTIKRGDYLTATLKSSNTFSFEEQFKRFVIEDCRENVGFDEFPAKAITKAGNCIVWLGIQGTPVFIPDDGKHNIGDMATVCIKLFGTKGYYGRIDAEVVGECSEKDYFIESEVQSECIEAFVSSTDVPVTTTVKTEKDEPLSREFLMLMIRIMFTYQKFLLKPSERYRVLSLAYILSELVGDDDSSAYMKFTATYLLTLVRFVNNETLQGIELETEPAFSEAKATLIRLAVVQILKEYGRKDNSEVLADTIETFKDDLPILSNLARLVQTANSLQGTLSDAAINVIRREIIKTLSLETEDSADLESESREYLGVESGTQEFKTSMIYTSTDHMQPNETSQNHNVLKGICAFLNSTTGGTLYLGVNDQGYVVGLDNDFKFLHYADTDHYLRYVQDCILKNLGKDCMMYISQIQPMFDGKVVAVHVNPHPYRVVELNNVAYIRINAESREMPESTRQELIAHKVFHDKDKAAAISKLQHAQSLKARVILHNYSSSNSGTVSNRLVEAYDVRPDENLIICYDCDKLAVRVFNINRIGYVEIRESEPWLQESKHKNLDVDAFHMTGNESYNVSLQLDLFAKNALVEEYPKTKGFVTEHKGDNNIWYYNAMVHSIEPISRFYMGLADHITIIKAPEMISYIKAFKSQWL